MDRNGWIGLDWKGLDRIGQDWTGLEMIGMDCKDWKGLEASLAEAEVVAVAKADQNMC